jgi:acyl-CoA synthetase (AMP-forming)/AMP-acid ligase II
MKPAPPVIRVFSACLPGLVRHVDPGPSLAVPVSFPARRRDPRCGAPAVEALSVPAPDVRPGVAPSGPTDTLLGRILANASSDVCVRLLGRRGGEEVVTHADLLLLARRTASGLRAGGVAAGEAVGVVLRPNLLSIASFFGVWIAGGVVVLLPPPGQLEPRAAWWTRSGEVLARTGATRLVADATGTPPAWVTLLRPGILVQSPPSEVRPPRPTDPAVVTTTSGTTESPRLLLRTQGSLAVQLDGHTETKGGTDPASDRRLGWGPLHRRALGGDLLYPLALGVETTLLPTTAFAARPLRWLEELSRYRATFSTAPAFAYRRVARVLARTGPVEGLDLRSWRHAHLAGERVDADVLEDFAVAAMPYGFDPAALCVSYGSRELGNIAGMPAGSGVRVDRVDRRALAAGRAVPVDDMSVDRTTRIVSVGRPNRNVHLRLLDAQGRDAPDRVVGEVVVRSPALSTGYLDGDEDGDERFQAGWFHTRDLGYRADGELFLVGRRDDVVIVNGVNVHVATLEQSVRGADRHDLDGVAVFLVRAASGDRLVLAVESASPPPLVRRDLRRHLAATGERSPDELLVLLPGTLPRTEEGKIRRRAAAAAFEAGALQEAPDASP